MADLASRGRSSESGSPAALQSLVLLLDGAASLQDETEEVMRACLAEGPKGAVLARRAGRLASALTGLADQAGRLPSSPAVEEGRDLLRYHQALLAATVEHAYDVRAVLVARPDPRYRCELGEPAVRLRRLRDLLLAYLPVLTEPPPTLDT